MRLSLGNRHDSHRRPRASRRGWFENLESRELFSAQPPITAAAPYSTAFTVGAYRDALGRAPDANALTWAVDQLDQGQWPANLASAIVGGDEYAANLVRSAYQQYLGRDAEPAATAYWVAALHSGMRDEQMLAALTASDEFYARAGGNDIDWIEAAYRTVLGRSPEPAAVGWALAELASGQSRATVAYELVSSLEHERMFVNDTFMHYLHAAPGESGLSFISQQLANGQMTDEFLVFTLMSSDSYYQLQTGVPRSVVPVPVETGAWNEQNTQIEAQAAQGNAQVLFLGDSITQFWQQAGNDVWNQYFAPFHALDAGIAGDMTQNVLWRIENGDLNGAAPKVAVLMLGINNILLGDGAQNVAAGITAVVDELRLRLPDTKIVLMGLLPAQVPAYGDQMPTILAVNQAIASLADGEHVFYLDAGPAFKNPDGTINTNLYQTGLVHPNAMGYAVLAQSLAPFVDELLTLSR